MNPTKTEKAILNDARTYIPESVHIKKVMEECMELSLAILWNDSGKTDLYDVMSELVDVEIVTLKYKGILREKLGDNTFNDWYKILRTEKFDKLALAVEVKKLGNA